MKPGRSAELDALEATPPPAFVKARNALVARLRRAGRASEAAAIARLRRPGVVPWLVNQLAHADPEGVRRLLEAADHLRRAHLRDPRAIPVATARHRAALQHLMQRAERILVDAELRPSPDLSRRVHATLSAAAADRGQHAPLRQGRLAEEIAPPGFEVLGGAPPRHLRLVDSGDRPGARTSPASPTAGARRGRAGARPGQAAGGAAQAQQRQAKKREAEAARRQRRIDRARRRAERLREQLRQAEDRLAREREEPDPAGAGGPVTPAAGGTRPA